MRVCERYVSMRALRRLCSFSLQAIAELMYDTALVTSGFTIDSPKDFAQRIYAMVGLAVNAEPAKADAAAAAPESTPAAAIDPEILSGDPADPWKS